MNLGLKGFKKIAQNKTHTIFEHPDGHVIHVAHDNLSRKVKKDMGELPHMAQGGSVQPSPSPSPSPIDPEEAKKFSQGFNNFNATKGYADGGTVSDFFPFNMASMGVNAASNLLSPQAAPQQQQAPAADPALSYQAPQQQSQAQNNGPGYDPYGYNAQGDLMQRGMEEGRAGIRGEAQAQAQAGQRQAQELQKAQAGYQEMINAHQQELAGLNSERQAFISDVKNSHIDPNRFINNMSTGQKILTTIGMVLAGAGAGAAHQSLDAANFLQKQIDEDIKSQQADLGSKKSLLEANLRQFGNLHDAQNMTRMQYMDMVGMKLKQAAETSQDPMAKAKAQQMLSELDMKMAPVMGQIAARRTLLSGMARGSVPPNAVIEQLVPKEHQKEAVDQLQKAQQHEALRNNVGQVFNELASINTTGNRVMSPLQTPKQVDAIREPLVLELARDTAGRVNDYELPMLRALFPAPGDSQQTQNLKKQRLDQFIEQKAKFPILDEYGIIPKRQAIPNKR